MQIIRKPHSGFGRRFGRIPHPSPSPTFFFFNDTATTEIYTLSLHDALPIYDRGRMASRPTRRSRSRQRSGLRSHTPRSEEHTSELQSQSNLVCRLLLEKKKKTFVLVLATGLALLARFALAFCAVLGAALFAG